MIQIGTEQDADSYGTYYYAWYELLPADSVTIPNEIEPGDVVTAAVVCTASCSSATQTWTMEITDSTAQWTWTQSFSYASSKSSADWIEEAPTTDPNTILPLADFGAVSFTFASADGSNPYLSLATDGYQMTDYSTSGPASANPSASTGGDSFSVCWGNIYDFTPCNYSGSNGPMVAAVLPSSRSVEVGVPATAFATIINSGSIDGQLCTISPSTPLAADFSFQATDPATNRPVGSPNTQFTIAAGGSQSFLLTITPFDAIDPLPASFSFACSNLPPAPILLDVNTLLISASLTAPPDIIALALTPTSDGNLAIPGSLGSNAFAVATANVGAGDQVTATATAGSTTLPAKISICQTDPSNGQCVSPIGPAVTVLIEAGATPTFGIFATATGTIASDPAANRIFVQFTDSSGVIRGLTSVAVATQ